MTTTPVRHVALLRGINVGGKNTLPMKALVTLFNDAGCTETRTYIQSGNVIFAAPPALARRIPDMVAKEIKTRFGYQVPVVRRTAKELHTIAHANPYLRRGTDSKLLHVAFLADRPTASRVARLDPRRSVPDECEVVGRDIYLHCPKGMARTKLTNAYFDATLATTSTIRSWATVLKLSELVSYRAET